MQTYDVVVPFGESSDVFVRRSDLNKVKRGDLIALRSAGSIWRNYGFIPIIVVNCRKGGRMN